MEYLDDTIIAISTAIAKSAIGIIRISGNNVLKILKIFFNKINVKPRYAIYCNFIDPNTEDIIDNGILIFFKKPKSYTGENMIEFQCHGNPIIMNYIIDLIVNKNLARIALNGEFTKIAFINNKINLYQAESILNIINSNNIYNAKLALKSLNGTFSNKINNILNNLIDIKVLIESYISFSEEDNNIILKEINSKFIKIKKKFIKLIKECIISLNINNTFTVSLIGNTNVGKSTIFNILINKNRSIITNIHGTTRDNIIDYFTIKNNLIRIIDTAGIRKTNDIIEKIGIKKTKYYIKKSNLLLLILDNNFIIDENILFKIKNYINDNFIYNYIINNINNIIIIKNKADISGDKIEIININKIKVIIISAKNKKGIDILLNEINNKLFKKNEDINIDFLISKRYLNIIKKSFSNIYKYKNIIECKDYTILYEDINYSINDLIDILGKNINNDDLLNSIFSKFCIGK